MWTTLNVMAGMKCGHEGLPVARIRLLHDVMSARFNMDVVPAWKKLGLYRVRCQHWIKCLTAKLIPTEHVQRTVALCGAQK